VVAANFYLTKKYVNPVLICYATIRLELRKCNLNLWLFYLKIATPVTSLFGSVHNYFGFVPFSFRLWSKYWTDRQEVQ